MSEADPTPAEAARENVAKALENVRRAKAHHRALRSREHSGTDAPTEELDAAARAVAAAEERLAQTRGELLAFFAA